MRWMKGRRLANVGPILQARALASLCLLIGGVASAQPEPQGWRGQLLAKADEAWSSAGAAEEVEQHVIDAIRTIDGMVGSAREQYVKDLADSIVMELHAFDAELKRRDGQPANAVIAFRAAIDRAHKVPALAARELELIDALAIPRSRSGTRTLLDAPMKRP